MKAAICLLCVRPNQDQAIFCSDFADYGFDVFVLADCNQKAYSVPPRTTLLQVPDSFCIEEGYHHFNTLLNVVNAKKLCSAWDKALYFFCKKLTSYDQVWFLEEDVFVPSLASLLSIQVQNPSVDFVCPRQSSVISDYSTLKSDSWGHWPKIPKIINKPPFLHTLCCISRVSRSLLRHIDEFASAYNQSKPARIDWSDIQHVTRVAGVPFIEIVLPMLTLHNNLTYFEPTQLQIRFSNEPNLTKYGKYDLSVLDDSNIVALSSQIYHPIKDVHFQNYLRKEMASRLGDVRAKSPNLLKEAPENVASH